MIARKGLSGSFTALSASMQTYTSTNLPRTTLSSYFSTSQRISATASLRVPYLQNQQRRLFSGSSLARASEIPRTPRPIPLDLGAGAAPVSTVTSTTIPGDSNNLRRSLGGGNGSFFEKFGRPLFNIVVYSTAATLVLHVLYHRLALEEYRIMSNKKIADLEAEIAQLKSGSVQHSVGGRGEFV
ncbi:hypothetical protein BGZ83_008503 [Gryganskiella cystojenkinii]|nr:hypothetical protein BGZ83_008503 [Gryganskiella cystojenkinii]